MPWYVEGTNFGLTMLRPGSGDVFDFGGERPVQRPRTMSTPERISSNWRLDSLPTSSVSNSRSRVMIWEAFATESLGRPEARAGRSTLPGASAHRRLLVKGMTTTVLIRLRLSASLGQPRPAYENQGPSQLDLEDSPNTHAPGRLPFNTFKCASCRR